MLTPDGAAGRPIWSDAMSPNDVDQISKLEEQFHHNIRHFWKNSRVVQNFDGLESGLEMLQKLENVPLSSSEINRLLQYAKDERPRYVEAAHRHRRMLSNICRAFGRLAASVGLDPEPFHDVAIHYISTVGERYTADPRIEKACDLMKQIKVKTNAEADVLKFAPKSDDEKPHLNETDEQIAMFIDAHPGKKALYIAEEVKKDHGTVRRIISSKLAPYGYHNIKGSGYYPPANGSKVTDLVRQRDKPSKN